MKRIGVILFALSILLAACDKSESSVEIVEIPQVPVSNEPIMFSTYIDSDFAETKAYGGTHYDTAKYFQAGERIAISAFRSPRDGSDPTENDQYSIYKNVGYTNGNIKGKTWTPQFTTTKIYAPLFTDTKLDIFAYFPWASTAEINTTNPLNIITDDSDLRKIKFRIHADQTSTSLKLDNIMRARIKGKNYPYGTGTTTNDRTATLKFEHILSLLEFRIHKADEPGNEWIFEDTNGDGANDTGDKLYLVRVVVLGRDVTTEGSFDLIGDDPNVKTVMSTSANGSIFKYDGTNYDLDLVAMTGATGFARRNVIVPPVNFIPLDEPEPDASKGEQAPVEFMFEMKWLPKGATDTLMTNRHHILRGHSFESGKRYVIDVGVTKPSLSPQSNIEVTTTVLPWTVNPTWTTTFN